MQSTDKWPNNCQFGQLMTAKNDLGHLYPSHNLWLWHNFCNIPQRRQFAFFSVISPYFLWPSCTDFLKTKIRKFHRRSSSLKSPCVLYTKDSTWTFKINTETLQLAHFAIASLSNGYFFISVLHVESFF